jgi:hypothetical protein
MIANIILPVTVVTAAWRFRIESVDAAATR